MEFLLRKEPAKVLLFLKGRESAYLSEIARETGTTYVYVTNCISMLEEKGMVSVEPEGKKKMVKLTEKGMDIAAHIEEIRRRIE
ncbi:MAG: DUF6293 family protein [Candidatus Micrarchaeia archaeon]